VTNNVILERLYLVSGLLNIALFVTMPSAPTSPPLQLFLDLRANIFQSSPSIFFPSTIRQVIWPSRYPQRQPDQDGNEGIGTPY